MIWKNIEKAIEFERNGNIPICKYGRELSFELTSERKEELGRLFKQEFDYLDDLIVKAGYDWKLNGIGNNNITFYVPGYEYRNEWEDKRLDEETWYAPNYAYFQIDCHFYPAFIELLELKAKQRENISNI